MLKSTLIRPRLILPILVIVPLGLLSKKYTGLAQWWVNDYSGDILYEVFWCLSVFLLSPNRQAVTYVPLGVFGVTCAIEFLQLWHQPVLDSFRSTWLGKLLLGTTFAWGDFPHYAVGCIIGWLLLRQVVKGAETETITRSSQLFR